METKLSHKQITKSLILFIVGVLLYYLLVFLTILMKKGAGSIDAFMTNNKHQLVTVVAAIAVLAAILYCYFFFESKEVLAHVSKILELFLIFYIAYVFARIMSDYVDTISRPIAFLALMCATLYKRRDAIFVNSVYSIVLLVLDGILNINAESIYYVYACFICRFCSGIVAVVVFDSIKTRFQCVLMGFILLIPVELINCIMILPIRIGDIEAKEVFDILIYGALSSVLSVMMFIFLLPLFEIMFSEMTVFRLRELTTDSAKLIKRLKENAPGTYSHSVVVSQLAEACAKSIGENSELARAAAYYHDVGKLKGPEMFAENQTDYNFHNDITPELSVDIIRSHTRNGAQLIKKSRLPEFFADVAIQHHGTMPIKYFYYKALKMSDGELNIDNYSYMGPTPTSKIAAIIMIADTSEAATRTLPDRTPEKVEELVRVLIEERLDMGQFENCNITMKELTTIKSTIVNQLSGVYHSRVAYPKLSVTRKK